MKEPLVTISLVEYEDIKKKSEGSLAILQTIVNRRTPLLQVYGKDKEEIIKKVIDGLPNTEQYQQWITTLTEENRKLRTRTLIQRIFNKL